MKIFIDSADLKEIEKYKLSGLCQGVTTNPSICLKCGVANNPEAIKQRIIEIGRLIAPYPVSVEVTSDNIEEVLTQAREYCCWLDNIAVKVTVTDQNGGSLLPAIYRLSKEGISVNVTVITTFNQAIIASRALMSGREEAISKPKFSFISIFAGRIADEHGVDHAFRVVKNFRQWLDFHHYQGIEIIAASIRSKENVELFSRCGAHILTIPPEIINQYLVSAKTKEGVSIFMADAQK